MNQFPESMVLFHDYDEEPYWNQIKNFFGCDYMVAHKQAVFNDKGFGKGYYVLWVKI